MSGAAPSERARVRRLPYRGAYDRATIDAILDEGFVAHVGIADESGQPFVLPMVYARDGDRLYLHGSAASRLLRALADGARVAVTVTLLDGLVLAKSAFHHSVNFRSVVVLGRGREVVGEEERWRALERVVEHAVPGRWADCRRPDEKELRATLVVEVPIEEASAKVRRGPPVDEERDLAHPAWAGVLPLALAPGEPVPEGADGPPPDYVARYRRPG